MFTINNIKELREITGAGMLDCKKALTEANGDLDEAITALRKAGIVKAGKKADREANEGLVVTQTSGNKTAIVQVSCETDFVARTDKFIDYVNKITGDALTSNAIGDLTETFNEKEKDELTNLIATIGENMKIVRVVVWEGSVVSYIHAGGRIGVLVDIEGADESLSKELALHIAAYAPLYLTEEDITEEVKNKEAEITREKNQNKPANILEKIIEGSLNKWYKEVCLLNQEWISDDKKTVAKVIGSAKINQFIRLQISK